MHIIKRWACLGFLACSFGLVKTLKADTNDAPLIGLELQYGPDVPRRFGAMWGHEFVIRAEPILTDRIGPPAYIDIFNEEQRDGHRIFDDLASRAHSGFERTLEDSLQETALKWWSPEIDDLGKFGHDHVPILGSLIQGSFGNTEETELDLVSPSYTASAWAWLASAHDGGPMQFGYRPWNTRPYGYMSIFFGGSHYLATDVRWYYDPEHHADQMEGQIVIPAGDCHLTLGGSLDPFKTASDRYPPQVSLRFDGSTGHRWLDVWSVGISHSFDGGGTSYELFFSYKFR